jgi:hypothetical protein
MDKHFSLLRKIEITEKKCSITLAPGLILEAKTAYRSGSPHNTDLAQNSKISWSPKAYGREPKSCLGQVFNSKVDRFGSSIIARYRQIGLHLKLKTWPRGQSYKTFYGRNLRIFQIS